MKEDFCKKCEARGKPGEHHKPWFKLCGFPSKKEAQKRITLFRIEHFRNVGKRADLLFPLPGDTPYPSHVTHHAEYGPLYAPIDMPTLQKPTYRFPREYPGLVQNHQVREQLKVEDVDITILRESSSSEFSSEGTSP
uniref:Uncharacterized protein n=1 Tax=Caenorhabditis japonica TaxID=281687 RepID=A0A8R1I235_CAEJA